MEEAKASNNPKRYENKCIEHLNPQKFVEQNEAHDKKRAIEREKIQQLTTDGHGQG